MEFRVGKIRQLSTTEMQDTRLKISIANGSAAVAGDLSPIFPRPDKKIVAIYCPAHLRVEWTRRKRFVG